MRDPNADMMYYVKNLPKINRKDLNLDIDETKGAAEQLFDSRDEGGMDDDEVFENDAQIDGFVDRMSTLWGQEET